MPLVTKEEEVENCPRTLFVIGKQFLKEIKYEKLCLSIVPKVL